MWSRFPFFPDQASSMAQRVDNLYFFLIGMTIFGTLLVAFLVIFFATRYRRDRNPVATQIEGSVPLEIFWTAVPLVVWLGVFVWAALLYFSMLRAPKNAMEVYVMGKQWMWHAQHPTGVKEINQLHVPTGRPVKLTMISQDVIHDFFIPAFRQKYDVLPGRYTSYWFEATQPGTYHLFCAEYCGLKHSGMIGEVIVMTPPDYDAWLSGGRGQGSLAQSGETLFTQLGCKTCHSGESGARGPNLAGVFGTSVKLANGGTVTADENYIRESVLTPTAKVVAGFQPIMPTFQGQVSEEGLLQLIAYVKSLQAEQGRGALTAPAMTEQRTQPSTGPQRLEQPASQPQRPGAQR